MTLPNNDAATPRELSVEELDLVAAGEWSWGDFAKELGKGAAAGALGAGAATGGTGTGLGAIGGALIGGIGYCIGQIF